VQDTIVRSVEALHWGTTTFVDTMDRHLGGNGANTARALALLGARVRLAGTVGNDDAAEFAVRELEGSGVETSRLTRVDAPNAATVVLVNAEGNRQFLHRLGCSAEAFGEALEFTPALIEGMQHFHLASLFVLPHLRTHAPEMLRRARAAGLTTSVDTNWDPHGEWLRVLGPCLPHADLLFLNEDESRMLTGTADPEAAARRLQSHGARTVIQKLSSAGCRVYPDGDGQAAVHCPAYRVEAVDSTGAGDCFAGGFLTAYLRGASWAEAAEDGNAAGALSVTAVGAVAGLVQVSDLKTWKRSFAS
jgi:sugar/nucleoside kinase (ribokinase family)